MSDEYEENSATLLLGGPLAVVFGAPIIIAKALLNAFVLYELWGWYLPEQFGNPSLSASFGVALIASFLVYQSPTTTGEDYYRKHGWRLVANTILTPLSALFAGWIGTFWP